MSASAFLPDDVWSTGVFPFLDYRSTLVCSEVCRQFLHRVVPALKQLVIERPAELHATPARKFIGVETIDVQCFVYSTRSNRKVLCLKTEGLLLSFLACFPRATNVYLCGRDPNPSNWSGPSKHFIHLGSVVTSGKYELFHRLMCRFARHISLGASRRTCKSTDCFIKMRSFPNSNGMYLHDFRAVEEDWDDRELYYDPRLPECGFCTALCMSIPVGQACRIKCAMRQGEVFEEFEERTPHSLCLTSQKKVEIIASREGGTDAYLDMFKGLYSKEKIDIDTIWGKRFSYCDKDGTPARRKGWYCSVFEARLDMLAELQVLMDRYNFPRLQHSEASFIEHLFRCVGPEEQLTRDRDKCFITRCTFEALCRLGLPLSHRFFVLVDDEYLVHDDTVGYGMEDYHETATEFTDEDWAKLRTKFQS